MSKDHAIFFLNYSLSFCHILVSICCTMNQIAYIIHFKGTLDSSLMSNESFFSIYSVSNKSSLFSAFNALNLGCLSKRHPSPLVLSSFIFPTSSLPSNQRYLLVIQNGKFTFPCSKLSCIFLFLDKNAKPYNQLSGPVNQMFLVLLCFHSFQTPHSVLYSQNYLYCFPGHTGLHSVDGDSLLTQVRASF